MSKCIKRRKPWCPLMLVQESSHGSWNICRASSYNKLSSNSVKSRKLRPADVSATVGTTYGRAVLAYQQSECKAFMNGRVICRYRYTNRCTTCPQRYKNCIIIEICLQFIIQYITACFIPVSVNLYQKRNQKCLTSPQTRCQISNLWINRYCNIRQA